MQLNNLVRVIGSLKEPGGLKMHTVSNIEWTELTETQGFLLLLQKALRVIATLSIIMCILAWASKSPFQMIPDRQPLNSILVVQEQKERSNDNRENESINDDGLACVEDKIGEDKTIGQMREPASEERLYASVVFSPFSTKADLLRKKQREQFIKKTTEQRRGESLLKDDAKLLQLSVGKIRHNFRTKHEFWRSIAAGIEGKDSEEILNLIARSPDGPLPRFEVVGKKLMITDNGDTYSFEGVDNYSATKFKINNLVFEFDQKMSFFQNILAISEKLNKMKERTVNNGNPDYDHLVLNQRSLLRLFFPRAEAFIFAALALAFTVIGFGAAAVAGAGTIVDIVRSDEIVDENKALSAALGQCSAAKHNYLKSPVNRQKDVHNLLEAEEQVLGSAFVDNTIGPRITAIEKAYCGWKTTFKQNSYYSWKNWISSMFGGKRRKTSMDNCNLARTTRECLQQVVFNKDTNLDEYHQMIAALEKVPLSTKVQNEYIAETARRNAQPSVK